MRRIALLTVLATLVPAGTAGASFSQDVGSPLPTGIAPYGVASADFDGNGKPDLVAANGDSVPGTISVYLRGASGWSQEAGSPYNTEPGADDAATADFNGDGRKDIAVASFTTDNGGTVFLRKPDNTGFVQEGGSMPITHATTVAAGDLNGDHKPDLVYGSGTSDSVYFALRNAGNTGFDAPVQLASVGHKRGVVIGDFSGDGKPDIAATNATATSIDLWVQNSSGPVGFAPAPDSPFTVSAQPGDLVIADFDGDHHLDVAATLFDIDKVVVLRGHSNKTLTKEAEYPAGDGPLGVATGDFNSDGRPDLAIADQPGQRVTVLLRTPGGFVGDPSSPIVTNQSATAVAVADFNVDTRTDVAVANRASNSITVLLNTTPFPPPPPPPDLDKDDDGVQTPLDCDDGNPLIKPGAVDIPGDGINQDCSADGDADYPLPGVKIKYSVLTYPAGFSKFAKLTLAPVKAGDTVVLKCKGRGCKFKKKTFNVKATKARLSLLKPLKKSKLRKGAAVTMRMTRAATYGSYARWKIGATSSKFKSLCLRPGNTKPVKCPST
jgi:hypothetical protein